MAYHRCLPNVPVKRIVLPRATKIVATLGPACSEPASLLRLLAAGVDVVRLNFSHGRSGGSRRARAPGARVRAQSLGREVGIMADLQGPKIRIGKFADGPVMLAAGQRFVLDAECKLGDGDIASASTTSSSSATSRRAPCCCSTTA